MKGTDKVVPLLN